MLEAAQTFETPVNWTFYCILPRPGRFDAKARALGATVIHSPVALHSKVAFMLRLRRTVLEGQYEIVHCHHDVISAIYLIAVVGVRIKRRIVHVHNADLALPTNNRAKAALLREPMRKICLLLSDRIVGISRHTLDNFLSGRGPTPPRDLILYYGIDTAPFHLPLPDKNKLFEGLKIPANARTVLFAGRLVEYKNPVFVVDTIAKLAGAAEPLFALFVGTGPLDAAIRKRAADLGVADRTCILGWRDDVSQLMRVADLFLFPRAELATLEGGKEGLGLVVVEAQAAGLPMLLSRGIPDDAVVVTQLCEFVSLEAGPGVWAQHAATILSKPRPDRQLALTRIEQSAFSLQAGFTNLMSLHTL